MLAKRARPGRSGRFGFRFRKLRTRLCLAAPPTNDF